MEYLKRVHDFMMSDKVEHFVYLAVFGSMIMICLATLVYMSFRLLTL